MIRSQMITFLDNFKLLTRNLVLFKISLNSLQLARLRFELTNLVFKRLDVNFTLSTSLQLKTGFLQFQAKFVGAGIQLFDGVQNRIFTIKSHLVDNFARNLFLPRLKFFGKTCRTLNRRHNRFEEVIELGSSYALKGSPIFRSHRSVFVLKIK